MKASELRIGNYLNGKQGPVAVSEIRENNRVKIQDNASSFTVGTCLQPIPLTEEWLLKFGFTLCENAAWYEKKIPTLGIVVSCNLHGRFCIEHTDEIVTIRDCCYKVHELQNLYFALTGEELTLKP